MVLLQVDDTDLLDLDSPPASTHGQLMSPQGCASKLIETGDIRCLLIQDNPKIMNLLVS